MAKGGALPNAPAINDRHRRGTQTKRIGDLRLERKQVTSDELFGSSSAATARPSIRHASEREWLRGIVAITTQIEL
jgi:hypothetical protein